MSKASQPAGVDRRTFIGAVASLFGLAADVGSAARAEYPDHVVTLIVPFAPGGASDLLARVLSAPLGAALGQSVIAVNRGGAGGNIGIGVVARAKPDGYTLLVPLHSGYDSLI